MYEQLPQQEIIKSVKEGGLEVNIEKVREEISHLTSMIDQIEHLQRVPFNQPNLGEGSVNQGQIPALDQLIDKREEFNSLQIQTEKKLGEVYHALMKQLSLLRDATGIQSKEEALKFDPSTGSLAEEKTS